MYHVRKWNNMQTCKRIAYITLIYRIFIWYAIINARVVNQLQKLRGARRKSEYIQSILNLPASIIVKWIESIRSDAGKTCLISINAVCNSFVTIITSNEMAG